MAQIGRVEVQTQNNGIVQVPVFDTGDAGSEVYDMVRVQTDSGVGFIPTIEPAKAKFPYIRVQTQNYGVLAFHDTPGDRDIAISFDTSGSMTTNNNLSPAQTDSTNMLDNLDESVYDVGLNSWKGPDTLILEHELGTTHSDIKSTIDGYNNLSGSTSPGQGIRGADEMLSGDDESTQIDPNVSGDDAPHVQVFFSDATDSLDSGDTEETDAATNAKNKGQHIFASVYNGVDTKWSDVTSDPDSTYLIDADNTSDVGSKLASRIKSL